MEVRQHLDVKITVMATQEEASQAVAVHLTQWRPAHLQNGVQLAVGLQATALLSVLLLLLLTWQHLMSGCQAQHVA